MEFGSKYVYTYTDSEEESVSDDEYEAGMDDRLTETSCIPASQRACQQSSPTDEDSDRAGRFFHASTSAPPQAPPRATSRLKKLHKWMLGGRRSKDAVSVALCESEHLERSAVSGASPQMGKKWRRADTNVVAIKFDQLKKPSNMHTGDPVNCQKCHAMMSHLSSVKEDGDENVWQCEFCEERNIVDILPEEIPKLADVTYMLKPAPATTATSCGGVDESLVVFCIDISGSMCVSKQVDGRMRLRGSHADRYQSLNTTRESQWLPGENHNVTYITRLQALQAAVDHQLEQLAKDHPTRRAALISFNSEVHMIGDGTADPVVIAGDKLGDQKELENIASSLALPTSIQTTRASLGEKLFELEEGGQTALGPAMAVAILMASKVPGSKVVMCTDGLANVGLGNLDTESADEHAEASDYYSQLGEKAKENGVTVSVLTIAGTDCRLVELGSVASETGGQVNIVDPLKLTEEFGNILANPIIATRVVATFIIHKGLYIRGEAEKSSCVKRDVGNVMMDTEITFEYGIRRKRHDHRGKADMVASGGDEIPVSATDAAMDTSSQPEQPPHAATSDSDNRDPMDDQTGTDTAAAADTAASDPEQQASCGTAMDTEQPTPGAATSTSSSDEQPSELPFQVQITYTDLDGAEAVRVLTQTQPVTRDRREAETNINMPVVGVHAAQQSSKMALEGQYAPSRLNAFMYQRLVARNAGDRAYTGYINLMQPMENQVRDAQQTEAQRSGRSMACYEEEEVGYGQAADFVLPTQILAKSAGARASASVVPPQRHHLYGKTVRRQTCSDEMSSELYSKKQMSSRMFQPREPSPDRSSDSDED